MNEESIFANAIRHQSLAERAAYLDEVCGDNDALRARVDALIHSHEQGGSFLDEPAAPNSRTVERSMFERAGVQIGPYKLLQEIGQGGMGIVYMAEQVEPMERRVALKIIKPGMDTRQVIARFEAERQALALMDHPNIAKVLDAATTESGRPYFVMELVNGVPITEYCDENRLTLMERLKLFLSVCQAVQHAHQKGIIHRDLKPSNVLVALYDHEAVAKVIDFGVAKAMSRKLTEKTLFTHFGEIVGTLEYMSPEQARRNQLDVDTRSDIYSLGVLMYELITGTTPFDRARLRSAAFDEVLRIFREEEPPAPSTRLSTVDTLPAIAANRQIDPKKLRAKVHGELDWIVMKALDKDRARRYDTINGFAADIQRYADDEPVIACPPSTAYRFRKFAKRNKAALVTSGLIFVTLLMGLVGITSQWWRAEAARAREVAQRRLAEAEADRADKQRDRAVQAEKIATRERDLAQRQRNENRRLLYVSDMIAAQQAWATANLARVIELLRRYDTPASGQKDLRKFAWHYLSGLCQRGSETPTLEGETGYIWSVAFSPDGKTLATASEQGSVKLWDVDSHRELHTLTGHNWAVLSIAYSPDGRTLASASADGSVKLWHTETAELLRRYTSPLATGVAISSTGKLLVGCHDGTVRLADPSDDTLRIVFGKPEGPRIWSVAFSPDGHRLAVGTEDGTVIFGDVNSTSEWTELVGHTPDGKTLASSSNSVRLWDVETGSELDRLIGHEQWIYDVAFSNRGRTLASVATMERSNFGT